MLILKYLDCTYFFMKLDSVYNYLDKNSGDNYALFSIYSTVNSTF